MGIAGHDTLGNLRPRVQVVAVEIAQLKAGDEQTAQAAVEIGLLDVTPTDGHGQALVFGATLQVGT